MSVGFFDASYVIFLIRHNGSDFDVDGAASPMYIGSSSESYSIVVISWTSVSASDISRDVSGFVDTKKDIGVGDVVVTYMYLKLVLIFVVPSMVRLPISSVSIVIFSPVVMYKYDMWSWLV